MHHTHQYTDKDRDRDGDIDTDTEMHWLRDIHNAVKRESHSVLIAFSLSFSTHFYVII